MSSNSTSRRLDRAFERISEARSQTRAHGHDSAVTPIEPESFFVAPPPGDALVSFDHGVAAALRTHLADQGLHALSALVDDLESTGTRLRRSDDTDHTVSAVVYQMH